MKVELEINAYRRKETEAAEGTFVARKNIKKQNAKQTGFTAVEQNKNKSKESNYKDQSISCIRGFPTEEMGGVPPPAKNLLIPPP